MLPAGGEELANSGQFQPPKSLFARTFGEVPRFLSSAALFAVWQRMSILRTVN
jgi:hypothetical protein